MALANHKPKTVGHLEACGLLMLVSAWGWIGGAFSQPDFTIALQIVITAVHYLPIGILLALGILLFVPQPPASVRKWVTGVALLSAVALAIIIPLGISNPNPNSFGPHNFADYFPVALLAIGIGTWLLSQLRRLSSSPIGRPAASTKEVHP